VIIPTYNELENLPLIAARVHKARPDVHILVVDDGSPDGTGRLADELADSDPDRVHVMHRTAKDGLGAAYLAAFGWGLQRGYSVLVEMDADGSHAPEQLYRLLDAIDNGADLAIGYAKKHTTWSVRSLQELNSLFEQGGFSIESQNVTATTSGAAPMTTAPSTPQRGALFAGTVARKR
jgi:glycosyltransferase involved in cell wall biosynthesis